MRQILTAFLLTASLANPFKFFNKPATPVQRVTASIVRITGISEDHPYSCTGFVVKPRKVLTAAHCVGESYSFDGFSARLLKKDEYYDLALFDVTEELKSEVTFRDEEVEEGEGLTAIGYGYGWEIPLVLAERVILPSYAVDEKAPVGIIVQGAYVGGMSGGPVLDKKGFIVGMVQRATSAIGFGVGTRFIKAFLFDAGIKL